MTHLEKTSSKEALEGNVWDIDLVKPPKVNTEKTTFHKQQSQ